MSARDDIPGIRTVTPVEAEFMDFFNMVSLTEHECGVACARQTRRAVRFVGSTATP